MWLRPHRSHMSAERQCPMGMHRMTVVPENFEPFDDENDDAD